MDQRLIWRWSLIEVMFTCCLRVMLGWCVEFFWFFPYYIVKVTIVLVFQINTNKVWISFNLYKVRMISWIKFVINIFKFYGSNFETELDICYVVFLESMIFGHPHDTNNKQVLKTSSKKLCINIQVRALTLPEECFIVLGILLVNQSVSQRLT